AGWQVSIVVAALMAGFGYWWLQRMIGRAVANGESFQARSGDPQLPQRQLPSPLTGLIPLLVVLSISFSFHQQLQQNALIVALLGGVLSLVLINFRHLRQPKIAIGEATTGALIAIGNTAAVVGFGSIAQTTPAFNEA